MAIRRLHHRPRPRHDLSGWDEPTPPPKPPAKPLRARSILLILLGIAVIAVLFGVRERRKGRQAAKADQVEAPARDRGPLARGPFGQRGQPPTAGDVLGALRTHASKPGVVVVEGNVIDAISREPVGGVEVVFRGAAGETTTTAAADGSYRIEVAPGEHRAFVRGDHVISVGVAPHERLPAPPDPTLASAPDDALAPLVAVNDAQSGVDLEVQRSGVVNGKVVDPRGRPVAGAVVRAEVGLWRPVLGTHIAETGADGTFRLEVPGGFYDLSAAHPDYAGAAMVYGQRPNVMVYPTIETDVELRLALGCVITGKVVKADGTPVGAGALERAGGFSADFAPAGVIAEDGSFRYTTVLDEELTLRAWPWKSPPAPAMTIPCRDGERRDVRFTVPDQGPDLSGRIVDAAGAPVAGAYIDIYGLEPGTMNQQERADDQGRWGVFALPPGKYAVTAHVPGRGIATARMIAPGSDLELRLSGTGALAGRVDGVADGATFQLEIAGCVAPHGHVMMPATTRLVPVIDGEYRIDDLPACRMIAHARTPARMMAIDARVEPGEVTPYDLDMSPPRRKRIDVTVIDVDGSAVPDAQVMVVPASGGRGPAPVTADARGLAVLDAHVGDTLHAFATDGAYAAARVGRAEVSDAPGGYEEITIVLYQ